MVPGYACVASSINNERFLSRYRASGNVIPPAAKIAAYSPELCPATISGLMPYCSRTAKKDALIKKIDVCALTVSRNSRSDDAKHKRTKFCSRQLDACSKYS